MSEQSEQNPAEQDPAEQLSSASKPQRRRIPILVLLPVIIFAALAALFLFQLTMGNDPSKIPSVLIGRPAPDASLPAVEGLAPEGVQLEGFSKADMIGKVSIVNVFASWCGPCRREHPLLEELAKQDGFQMIGINYKDKPENARRFLGSLGNPYDRVGSDPNGRAAIDWGVYGIPETFIVDATGTIRYKYIGPLSPTSYRDEFLPQLEVILQTPNGPQSN
ncbi:thiol:disulfide interchange protein CycY [Roseibium sp. TrichSKD4]|uniref:DsbE family thiol:disulfide interchange protein n=1 Tax=Roseibium sp. TrichSKD4 TaxID=744980 RepID=UPI0001E56C2C|nr:DsbE family thiol:disulfide interchange protein [Roseibium sp. TrichSKD4]EFO32673.1 thiol:disulfide interchange protein CycY [Roseibium sp. TrichSKD4]